MHLTISCVVDEVRICRQFQSYSGHQEDLQVGDHVYAVVLPLITNSRKLAIRWSSPLIVNKLIKQTMIEVKEIRVKKPRVYVAKQNGSKDLNPSFVNHEYH